MGCLRSASSCIARAACATWRFSNRNSKAPACTSQARVLGRRCAMYPGLAGQAEQSLLHALGALIDLDHEISDLREIDRFASALRHCREVLVAIAREECDALADYLKPLRLTEPDAALVDCGWALSTHRRLEMLAGGPSAATTSAPSITRIITTGSGRSCSSAVSRRPGNRFISMPSRCWNCRSSPSSGNRPDGAGTWRDQAGILHGGRVGGGHTARLRGRCAAGGFGILLFRRRSGRMDPHHRGGRSIARAVRMAVACTDQF